MTKQILIREIKKWLKEYEDLTGELEADNDTLEGGAYILLSNTLRIIKGGKE